MRNARLLCHPCLGLDEERHARTYARAHAHTHTHTHTHTHSRAHTHTFAHGLAERDTHIRISTQSERASSCWWRCWRRMSWASDMIRFSRSRFWSSSSCSAFSLAWMFRVRFSDSCCSSSACLMCVCARACVRVKSEGGRWAYCLNLNILISAGYLAVFLPTRTNPIIVPGQPVCRSTPLSIDVPTHPSHTPVVDLAHLTDRCCASD